MAGHSQFKNIMVRKGAQDARRGRLFTKIIRELTTAAKQGQQDPAANPRLRAAMAIGRPRLLMGFRPLLQNGCSWDDALAYVAAEGVKPARR